MENQTKKQKQRYERFNKGKKPWQNRESVTAFCRNTMEVITISRSARNNKIYTVAERDRLRNKLLAKYKEHHAPSTVITNLKSLNLKKTPIDLPESGNNKKKKYKTLVTFIPAIKTIIEFESYMKKLIIGKLGIASLKERLQLRRQDNTDAIDSSVIKQIYDERKEKNINDLASSIESFRQNASKYAAVVNKYSISNKEIENYSKKLEDTRKEIVQIENYLQNAA
jgi:hypothetical protein